VRIVHRPRELGGVDRESFEELERRVAVVSGDAEEHERPSYGARSGEP